MGDKGYQAPEGRCIISEDVIATIASTAAMEVPGVASMATRTDIRGLMNSSASKSVAIVNNENETVVTLYINLKLGVRIPDVAGQVQRAVKSEVQSMTGKPVTKVNVHVAGVVLEDAAAKEEEKQ
ncbi:MAG: Asp23/Gls24 family envelope stress response protein [Clostridia bacterium]|nr:Asp23/Gls24 family envelope stress response protein [Clostridia bacterium]